MRAKAQKIININKQLYKRLGSLVGTVPASIDCCTGGTQRSESAFILHRFRLAIGIRRKQFKLLIIRVEFDRLDRLGRLAIFG